LLQVRFVGPNNGFQRNGKPRWPFLDRTRKCGWNGIQFGIDIQAGCVLANYVACTVTARPQPRSPMGRGRASPRFGKATLHRTEQCRFGRGLIARVKGEKIGRIAMDRLTRCPKCGKRMVPVVTFSGRTDLQCISCDDPAVKWADSTPIAPEKPIVAEPVASSRAA